MSNHLRNVVCHCLSCDKATDRICRERETVFCNWCGLAMEQRWWLRTAARDAQWSDADAVVVFKKPDGSFSYPAVNTKPTPADCERVVMRSLREVERHEKEAGVRSEIAWFDKGTANGNDTKALPSLPFSVRR